MYSVSNRICASHADGRNPSQALGHLASWHRMQLNISISTKEPPNFAHMPNFVSELLATNYQSDNSTRVHTARLYVAFLLRQRHSLLCIYLLQPMQCFRQLTTSVRPRRHQPILITTAVFCFMYFRPLLSFIRIQVCHKARYNRTHNKLTWSKH